MGLPVQQQVKEQVAEQLRPLVQLQQQILTRQTEQKQQMREIQRILRSMGSSPNSQPHIWNHPTSVDHPQALVKILRTSRDEPIKRVRFAERAKVMDMARWYSAMQPAVSVRKGLSPEPGAFLEQKDHMEYTTKPRFRVEKCDSWVAKETEPLDERKVEEEEDDTDDEDYADEES
jgi:hypothetical protein